MALVQPGRAGAEAGPESRRRLMESSEGQQESKRNIPGGPREINPLREFRGRSSIARSCQEQPALVEERNGGQVVVIHLRGRAEAYS